MQKSIFSLSFLLGLVFLGFSQAAFANQQTTIPTAPNSNSHTPFHKRIMMTGVHSFPRLAKTVDEIVRADWYDTVVPSEHYDSARTHRFPDPQFTGDMNGDNIVNTKSFEGVFPTPYNLVTRDDGELFVYGGGYGDNPLATGAFIARLDPVNMTQLWRTELINTNETGDWNYPGVVGVHANGDLYAIYGYRIARLDPETGDVLQEKVLPVSDEARDTSYNGFTVLADGTIVAKTISRAAGCEEQGFNALLLCPGREDVSPSIIVAIDPETLMIKSQITAPEATFGRITSGLFNGIDYVYLVGVDNLYRYRYVDGQIAYDETWGPVRYRLDNQTEASAAALLGDFVVLQTNGRPARAPLSVVAVSQGNDDLVYRLDPFADSKAPLSFIPSMLSVDPENNRIYAHDGGVGRLAALDFDPKTGLSLAWSVEQRTLSFTTLVDSPDTRVLVGTNILRSFNLLQLQNEDIDAEEVVWRDAATGKELARSKQLSQLTPGILVTPGFEGVFYYLGFDGEIFELHPVVKPAK